MSTPFQIRLSGPITDVAPLPTPSQLAEHGANAAASHAAHLTKSDWKGIALNQLRYFARVNSPFQCSDFRAHAELIGLPSHPNMDSRAFGAVIQAAAKEGWIKPIGYARTERRESHGRMEQTWTFVEART